MLAVLLLAVTVPGFQTYRTTARADYYVQVSDPMLKTDVEHIEKTLARLEKESGASIPRFRWFRVRDSHQLDVAAFGNLQALTSNGLMFCESRSIYSSLPHLDHELVHLVNCGLGNPGAFWDEGAAHALGSKMDRALGTKVARAYAATTGVSTLAQSWGTLRNRMDSSADPRGAQTIWYGANMAAGTFVEWLMKHHGRQKWFLFYRSCKTPADAPAAFRTTYGVDVDTMVTQWLGTPKGSSRK